MTSTPKYMRVYMENPDYDMEIFITGSLTSGRKFNYHKEYFHSDCEIIDLYSRYGNPIQEG